MKRLHCFTMLHYMVVTHISGERRALASATETCSLASARPFSASSLSLGHARALSCHPIGINLIYIRRVLFLL